MEGSDPDQVTAWKEVLRVESGVNVLIVEDESIIALDLSQIVAKCGHSVLGIVGSGEDSIREAGKIRPDVILMDITIKGQIDGLEAARMIGALFQIPIIYTTAFSDSLTIERARATKPLAYIQKPFDERELESVLSGIRRKKSSAKFHEPIRSARPS
jgi:CheY-like chemotaxis protein